MADTPTPAPSDRSDADERDAAEGLDTRTRLLTAAARQFARRGYDGASLRAIGDSVGIRAASIFHHFPGGKQELYASIFEAILHEISALVQERMTEVRDSPAAAIKHMALAFWDFFEANPDFAGLILRESFDVEGAQADAVRGRADAVLELSLAYIRQAQEAGKLACFDPHAFTLHAMLTTVTFHGAPAIARRVVPASLPPTWARETYERSIDGFLQGT